MSFKKLQRVTAPNYQGAAVFGFVTRNSAGKTHVVLDDGVTNISGKPTAFKLSTEPVPKTSPFANPPKKGTYVNFDYAGQIIFGTVKKVNVIEATIIADGGETSYAIALAYLRIATKAPPKDPPSIMDRWSVVKYKPSLELSDETTAFTADIQFNEKTVAHAKNNGTGGSNLYYGDNEAIDKLEIDAKEWARQFGYPNAFEAADLWLSWYTTARKYNGLASDYMKIFSNQKI